jgi:phosphatidylglycerophosphatase A
MLKLRPVPLTISPTSPIYLIATWFHSGRIRPASGSWGTLAALPACALAWLAADWVGLVALIIVSWFAGIWAITAYAEHADKLDPSEVVIDEVFGLAVTLLFILPATATPLGWFLGFVLFRIFDSIKRGPVGWCDSNIKGAVGVMVDDAMAGVLAGITSVFLLSVF